MASESRNFVETFRDVAVPVLARHPQLCVVWENLPDGEAYKLRIPKSSPTGFDVGVEVQTYGLYPFGGDWHGAPWDITTPGASVTEKCRHSLGLMRVLLSTDTRLRVRYAGGRPYKCIVEMATSTGWKVYEDVGSLFFFRFWTARSEQLFQNDKLPPLGFASGAMPLDAFATEWP